MKNWKLLFSIALSALVLFNTLSVSLTYAYYKLDPKGFIEALCENKDKPELACNGKCHLKKVTKTTDEKGNMPIQLTEIKDILLYNEKPLTYSFTDIKDLKSENLDYLNLYNYSIINNCFHPPEA